MFYFFLLVSNTGMKAQSDTLDQYLERLIEAYIENNDGGDFDYTQAFEVLEDIREKPINLNNATEAQLSELFFLSPIQRQDILQHREKFGEFLSIYELQSIKSLDMSTIRLLSFYVNLKDSGSNIFNVKQIGRNSKQTLFLKYKNVLQKRKGYIDEGNGTNYLGNDKHFFVRYRFDDSNNFRVGFTAEKDPGEMFFSGVNKKGFDFYSGHLFIQNISSKIKAVAIGDFTASFGQGLILHNDFGSGKSAYVMDLKKSGKTLKPYSSVNESSYFRGIGITTNLTPTIEFSILASSKYNDGNAQVDTIENEGFEFVSSIIRSGYHRTEAEINDKNTFTQKNVGAKIQYRYKRFTIGLNHLSYFFNKPLNRTSEFYNLYAFRGEKLHNSSIDYSYIYRNFNLFGEMARSGNGGIAQIHSLLIALDKKVDASISVRRYGSDYQVLEANAFSEGSLPINENAIYFGAEIRPNNSWKFSTYFDMWQNPWLKFRVDAPSGGKEALARIEYSIKRKFNIYLQYRYELKQQNTSLQTEKIDYITNIVQHKLRLHLSQKVTKEFEIRSRAEVTLFEKENNQSKGYLLYQDFIYKPIAKSYSFNGRFALFDTQNFDSRIYTYENDILYEFAIPFLANKGRRAYVNFRHKLTSFLTWEIRYAITKYKDLDVISKGGNEEINGDTKSEVKAQIKFSF